MATHVELDENLLKQVLQLGQFPSETAALQAALTEFVKTLKRQQLSALRGKVEWQGDLNQLRASRDVESPK